MEERELTAPTNALVRRVLLGGVVVFVLLAAMAWHSESPLAWERPIITVLQWLPIPVREFWIAMFEPIPFALTATALGLTAAALGRPRLALAGLGGCLIAVMTAQLVVKPMVHRVRLAEVGVHHHLAHLGGPMFPSSHATAAAAWAMFAWLIVGRRSRLTPLLIALPLVVSWATIDKHMHYPADVIGGMILGSAVVYCTVAAARVTQRRVRARAPEPERSATSDVGVLTGF